MSRTRTILSNVALVATTGLFLSTAIQVGFALNLHVPTVPLDITMGPAEAARLPGLAARDWAAGACLMFAAVAVLAMANRFDRRLAHTFIGSLLFVTLLPIAVIGLTGTTPPGTSWIVVHHLISGALIFATRPRRRAPEAT
jgi:hypothetical protein